MSIRTRAYLGEESVSIRLSDANVSGSNAGRRADGRSFKLIFNFSHAPCHPRTRPFPCADIFAHLELENSGSETRRSWHSLSAPITMTRMTVPRYAPAPASPCWARTIFTRRWWYASLTGRHSIKSDSLFMFLFLFLFFCVIVDPPARQAEASSLFSVHITARAGVSFQTQGVSRQVKPYAIRHMLRRIF